MTSCEVGDNGFGDQIVRALVVKAGLCWYKKHFLDVDYRIGKQEFLRVVRPLLSPWCGIDVSIKQHLIYTFTGDLLSDYPVSKPLGYLGHHIPHDS